MNLKLFFGLAGIVLTAVSPVWAQDGGNAAAEPEPVPVLAADGANVTTGLQAGLDAYQSGNYAAALKELIPLANKGDATAQLRLGVMNEMGQGVPQNYKRAVARYRQAAKQGNAEAQYRLGEMYGLGKGVPQNKKIATEWYNKSASQRRAEAQAKVKAEEEARAVEQAKAEEEARLKADEEARAAKQAKLEAKAKEGAAAQPPVSGGNTALVRIERFQVKGNTLLDAGLIERLLAPYTGAARSYTDIQRALETLEGTYRAAGYSAVHVVTPEQEVIAGIVIFQVIESMIGKVILSGNEHYDKANIRNALPALAEGFTPSARELSENIRLANENPTRQIDVVLAMGEEVNTVDAQVNVQDRSPHKVFLTLDNTGNPSTGMYRTGVGYQHNNLFNRDHAATFNYITSPNHIKDVTQLSASYRLPIYAVGDSIDLIAAYSDTNAGTTSTVAGPLTFSGKGHIYSAHYNHYLPRQGEYTSKIIGGLDYRAYINNCTISATACPGIADVTVHPLSVTYDGTLTKPTYVANFTAAIVRNLPGGSRGGPADFSASRPSPAGGAGAPAGYSILRLNGSLAGALPQNWQYRLAGNAQYTRDALISGESFGLVGASAVRGFLERELSNDKGYVLNVELYTPDMASKLNMKDGSFRLLGFIDRASGWNERLAGDLANRTSAGSVGAGFRYTHGKNIMARFDLARVNGASANSKTGDTRGHISLVASW